MDEGAEIPAGEFSRSSNRGQFVGIKDGTKGKWREMRSTRLYLQDLVLDSGRMGVQEKGEKNLGMMDSSGITQELSLGT